MISKTSLRLGACAAPFAYAFATLLAMPNMAFAQTSEDRAGNNNEIIVTARKQEERLLDVPAAISVVTNSAFENSTMSNLSDIQQLVPNVLASPGSLSPNFTIRGISSASGTDAGFPPAIGVYVDEVYQGRDPTFNTVLNDIERVEMLRGPQGTLYGKNTIGGAINIITAQPTEEFALNADVTLGNYDLVQIARFSDWRAGARSRDGGRLSINTASAAAGSRTTTTGTPP